MESIGRYKLIRKIGSGGMAEVFLTRFHGAEGTVKLLVIKKVHPALAKNAKFISMFVDEARVAMRLNHTNIVQVYSFEQIDGAYILAMEYVEGMDLLDLELAMRKRETTLSSGLAAYVAAEVAKGLGYAHSRLDDRGDPLEIVHRDVSPQNILISREGAVKIADFGIARARWLHEDAPHTIKGKFGYMPPEQAAGEHVDQRSDIYALGVVLFEMLIGRPLLTFDSKDDPRKIIRETRHPEPRVINPAIPLRLSEIVAKAVSFDPEDRYQTAREMARELLEYLHSETQIYDSETLESCVQGILPRYASEPPGKADSFSATIERTTQAGRHWSTIALGKIEQRPSIVVSGRFEIAPHPSRSNIGGKLTKLISEMAFKAEGILRTDSSDFFIYLSLVSASLDDAIRSIRLANDIIDATRALSRDHRLTIRLKLATFRGLVHVKQQGRTEALDFEPDPDIRIARDTLFATAQYGQIVVDSQVYRLARREYNFSALDLLNAVSDVEIPGDVPESSPVYELLGPKSRMERSSDIPDGGTFFGRKNELRRLMRFFEIAQRGRLLLVKLTGEMGIGKTRLIDRFLTLVPRESVHMLKVDCLFAERDRPLAAAVAAIRAALSIGESETSSEIEKSLERFFAHEPYYKDRQLRFFREFLRSSDTVWAQSSGNQRALVQRTAFGLGVILQILARRLPLIIVVENAHWLDGPSVDVLTELVSERTQISALVIVVGQPATLTGRKVPDLIDFTLEDLPGSVIRKIILSRLGMSDGMFSIAQQILARTQGNPFFANEIVDSLIEQGIVVPVTGEGPPQFRQARPGTIRLPATIDGIAESRLAALPPDIRTVLRTASAVGNSFDGETVRALVGHDVEQEIQTLVSQGLLIEMPVDVDREPTYRFEQPMLREVAYAGLAAGDRQRIHRTMAARLASASATGDAVPEVRIAWHLERAGEKEAAGRRYMAAAGAALAIYSDRETLKLYDRAIPLLRADSKERFYAVSIRERILRYLGRFTERASEIDELDRMAHLLGDDNLVAEALTRRAQLRYDQGDFQTSARILTDSLELARESGDVAQQVEALRLLAYVAIQEGHIFRALDCSNRALSIIPEYEGNSFYLTARSLAVKGYALIHMSQLDDAASPLAEALVLFRRLSKRRNESQMLWHLSLLAQARGELVEAIEFIESALRIDVQVRGERGRKLAALAAIRTEIGDFEGAYADIERSETICLDNGELVGIAEAGLTKARLKILEGNATQSIQILEQVGKNGVVEQSRLLLVRHRQLAAMAFLLAGRLNTARRLAAEASRVSLKAGMNGEAVHGGALQGLILAELGLESEALSTTRRATDLLSMVGKVRRAEEVWWFQALTLQKAGNPYRAERSLAEAHNEVERKRALINDPRLAVLYDNHPLVRSIRDGLG